ncbi:PilZ domain protein [Planctomycetes bacterium Pan216]|uniref:PilZ domain protein n=1 Tax=Kolteria novifilia TaxID=2527975 RepID=A0A518BC49_9BACT|nr:PilZ domain protein [Planctomycetes bacterium Pan216]
MPDHCDHSEHQRGPTRLLFKPKGGEKRRQAERITTRRSVLLRIGDDTHHVSLLDLSPTGSRVLNNAQLPIETRVVIDLLPEITLDATIRWCKTDVDGFQLGVHFDEPLAFETVWKVRAHRD